MRHLALEGWKRENIIGVDVVDDYWRFGLDLFKDKDTINMKGQFGNIITDPAFATSIGTFDVIWTGFVLHVFNKEDCRGFIGKVFTLLNHNGTYFGACAGSTEETEWIPDPNIPKRYLHSENSLRKLLEETGFVEIEVRTHENVIEGNRGTRWGEKGQEHGMRRMLAFKAKKL